MRRPLPPPLSPHSRRCRRRCRRPLPPPLKRRRPSASFAHASAAGGHSAAPRRASYCSNGPVHRCADSLDLEERRQRVAWRHARIGAYHTGGLIPYFDMAVDTQVAHHPPRAREGKRQVCEKEEVRPPLSSFSPVLPLPALPEHSLLAPPCHEPCPPLPALPRPRSCTRRGDCWRAPCSWPGARPLGPRPPSPSR